MTSFACVMAWLVALLTVPLMLFIRMLDTKKPESTDIKVTAGLGKRLLIFMALVLLLLGGGLWLED